MKYLVFVFLIAPFISTSHACSFRRIDLVNEASVSKNVSIGIITSISSADSENYFTKVFEQQNVDSEEETDRIVITSCGCKSSYQLVSIRSTSIEKVKGKPSKLYEFNFKTCIDKPSYALFSKLAIFESEGGTVTWKQIDEAGINELKKSIVETVNQ